MLLSTRKYLSNFWYLSRPRAQGPKGGPQGKTQEKTWKKMEKKTLEKFGFLENGKLKNGKMEKKIVWGKNEN